MEDLRAELATEVARVASRLRSLSQTRLVGPVPGHPSRAAAARAAAQTLADTAAEVESRWAPTPTGAPVPRRLPVLTEFAAGDQVAVTGHDLLVALAAAPDAGGPAARIGPGVRALLTEALEQLRTLRRLL